MSVTSLANKEQPVLNANCVFMPRQSDPTTGEHVSAVLAAAVNYCGAEVVTDYKVDGNGAPITREPRVACFDTAWIAIRGLLRQCDQSGAGVMGIPRSPWSATPMRAALCAMCFVATTSRPGHP